MGKQRKPNPELIALAKLSIERTAEYDDRLQAVVPGIRLLLKDADNLDREMRYVSTRLNHLRLTLRGILTGLGVPPG